MESPQARDEGPQTGIALIGLGGNVPWRGLFGAVLCDAALAAIADAGGEILARSQVRATPAWPDPSQPTYWNAAARVRFAGLEPAGALALLLAVERQFDRERGVRWAARTLDLDLLDFDRRVVSAANLDLPHPRLAERRFVLEPLAEIAADWRHPASGASAQDLLARLDAVA